jgi:hypothetical protein
MSYNMKFAFSKPENDLFLLWGEQPIVQCMDGVEISKTNIRFTNLLVLTSYRLPTNSIAFAKLYQILSIEN